MKITVVSTSHRWITDYFGAHHDFGFRPYVDHDSTLIWCPSEYAAQVYVEQGGYPLSSTLLWPEWVAPEFLGRTVLLTTGATILSLDGKFGNKEVFCKSADTKLFDPKISTLNDYSHWIQQEGLLTSDFIISDLIEGIEEEWRCLILGNECLDVSQYRDHDLYADQSEQMWTNRDESIIRFATRVAESAHGSPPSYCLDVARLSNGELTVLEANPIWCSTPYSLSSEHYLLALAEEYVTDNVWVPDDALIKRAMRRISW